LEKLCDISDIFLSLFILSEEFGDLGARPLKSSGSADIYKTTYRGRAVAVKALEIRHPQTPEYTHKVRARRVVSVVNYIYLPDFPEINQGSDFVGMASAREHYAVHWNFCPVNPVLDFL